MPFLGKFPTQIVDPEVDIDGGAIDGVTIGATTASAATVTTLTSGNITTTGYIAGPSTFTIDPAAVGDNTGTLVVAGNLQVDGTTTTINSTTMTVDDLNITLASGAANAAAANGAGITVDGASATLTYNSTPDAWSFNKNVGIGTTSPAFGLSVETDNGSGYAALFRKSSSDPALTIQTTGGITQIQGLNSALTATSSIAMQISGGNVGIGISSPQRTLHINGGATRTDVQLTLDGYGETNADGVQFGILTTGSYIWNFENTDLYFATNNTRRLTIAPGGNVGIGTSSPTTALHVSGTTGTKALFENTGSTGSYIGLKDSSGSLVYLGDNNGTFEVQTAGSSYSTKLAVTSAGNVGIGTTGSPLARLHVKGENGNQLSLDNDASQFTQANWYNNGAQKAAIWYDNSKAEFASYSTTELTFYTGGNSTTAIATIDSSGNLGIGTNSPSYALEVYRLVPNSGIISRFASGSSGGWIQLADTNGSWQMGSTSNGLEFYADAPTSQYRLTLSSSGNLGIGTRTPGNTLTVNKDTGSTPTVYINNSGGDAGDGVALKVQASGRGVGVKDADVFSVHNNAGEIFTVRNDGYAEAATGFAVPFKHFPDASFGGAGNTTGRIKIALPDTANDYDMVTIELTVYQYNDTAGSKILISGHNWSNNGWYYVSVQVIGKYNKSIKLARSASDNKYYILLGDTTDNWSYVTVHVNEVTTAPFYSTVTDWTQGWSITQVSTDTTTYSAISGDYNTTGSRTLKTNGYVNSSGIIFGSATAAANALDDYEEGTYTPVYAGTSATGSTTYGYQQGVYTKIGRTVTVWIDITITAMSGASGTPIITLPFVSGTSYGTDVNGNIINDMGGFISWQIADTFTSTSRPTGWVPNNSGAIHMYRYTTGGAGSLSAWILNTTGRISGKIIYTAAF